MLRRFAALVPAAAMLATLGAMTAQPARAQESVTLKVSHFLPPPHLIHKELVRWGKELKEKSNGRLSIEIYPAGQMGPPHRQYDLARRGVADVSFFLHGATPGRFPLTELSHLPFLIPDAESGTYALNKLLPKYLAQEHKGVKVLYLTSGPPLQLYTRDVTVRHVEDLDGLRVRHPGSIAARTLSALGATPIAVPPPDISDSLLKGTIDGALITYEFGLGFKLANVAKHVTELSSNGVTFALVMNQDVYDGLPDDLRRLVDETTSLENAVRVGKIYDQVEIKGREYLSSNGVEIIEPTDQDHDQFQQAAQQVTREVVAEAEEKGLPAKQFMEDFQAAVQER